MKKQVTISVKGKVQGVFYRFHTKKRAREIGLQGYVQNMDDGSVKIVAEGEEKDLEKLVEWARRGPPFSKVEGVSYKWAEATNRLGEFEIRY